MKLKPSIALLALTSLLVLPGCFGFGDDEPATTGAPEIEPIAFYRIVESDEFALQVPEDWETIQEFTTDYPSNTVVAFRNNVKNETFVANVNIVKNTVAEGTTSQDYALDTIDTVADQLLNYQSIAQTDVTLWVGDTEISTTLAEFEGTNDGTKTVKQFIQLYAVSGTNAYIVTGTYDETDTELVIDQVKQTVQTFRLN